MQNTKTKIDNRTGYKGIVLRKETGRYRARIQLNGKAITIGNFSTPEEAHAAYKEAAEKHFGEYASTRGSLT